LLQGGSNGVRDPSCVELTLLESAIYEALVVFADVHRALPIGLRRRIEQLVDMPGLWHKFARNIREELAKVPVANTA
jgi:hypothetical protein